MTSAAVAESSSDLPSQSDGPIMTASYEHMFNYLSIRTFFSRLFVKSIASPAIRALPTMYMFVIGGAVHVITLLMIISIFTANYQLLTTHKVLSLQSDAGVCNSILITADGVWLGDMRGNWQGTREFDYSTALYQFEMNNWATNQSNFENMMTQISDNLNYFGEIGKTQNLAKNILFWISASLNSRLGGFIQRFSMSGDAATVFDRQYQRGSVGNYFGDCNASSTTVYDGSTYKLTLSYSYSEFISNPTCIGALNPTDVGYNAQFDNSDVFALNYDVRTLLTAVAVNEGYSFLADLTFVGHSADKLTYQGDTYLSGYFYDQRYPDMQPIACMLNFTDASEQEGYTATLCGLMMDNSYYTIPLFESYGADDSFPTYCDCFDGTGQTANCNIFNFLSGLLFFPVPASTSSASSEYNQYGALFELLQTYQPVNISKLAYSAMFAGANVDKTSTASYFNSAAYRAEAYDWCAMSTGNCSILAINSVDTLNTAVNSYHYQLPNGSCTDSFTSPYFYRLADTPPIVLTTPYFECHETSNQAVVDAAGVAVEFTLMALPFIIWFLVNTVLFCRYTSGTFDYRLYTKEKRDRLLDLLSLQMLMTRDGKVGEPAVLSSTDCENAQQQQTQAQPPPHPLFKQLLIEMRNNLCINGDYAVLAATQSGVHGFLSSLLLEPGFAQHRFIESDLTVGVDSMNNNNNHDNNDGDGVSGVVAYTSNFITHRFQCSGAYTGELVLKEITYKTRSHQLESRSGPDFAVLFVTFQALSFVAVETGCIEVCTLSSLCPKRPKDMFRCICPPLTLLQSVAIMVSETEPVGDSSCDEGDVDTSIGYLRWTNAGQLVIFADTAYSTSDGSACMFKAGVSYTISQFSFCYEI